MQACQECGSELDRRFRFCPWCAAPQRRKVVEFFRAHPDFEDETGMALRVSHYFGDTPEERHVRFSVWDESGEAKAAVSLDEETAARLATFLQPRRPSLLDQLRHLAHR
jgi:hypothetical protein